MRTRSLAALLLLVALAPLVAARPVDAQEPAPTDLSAYVAAGAGVQVLASATVSLSAESSASPALRLSRVTPPNGDALPLVVVAAPELWYVEAGSLALVAESGARQQAGAGQQLVLTESGQYTVEITGPECPAALRLELTNVIAMRIGTDEEAPRLGPDGRACPVGGVLTDAGDPLAARADPATATIARVTWSENVFAGDLRFSGPVAYAVESGVLTIDGLPDAVAGLGPGSWLALPTGHRHWTSGQDGKAASALVVGAFAGADVRVATPAPTEPPGVSGSSYLSPTYGYRLSWDTSWQVVAESSTPGADTLQLTNGVSQVYLQGSAFDGDAVACVDGIFANMPAQQGFSGVAYRETADGRPLVGGDAAQRFAVIQFTYTSDSGAAAYTEYVECRTLAGRGAVVVATQIVPSEQYAGQVDAMRALLATLVLP